MSKPWGGVGAWALEAEREEAEERELASSTAAAAAQPESFPSLKEAAAARPGKKKGKGTTLSLSEFTTGSHVGPGAAAAPYRRADPSKFLTPDEMLRLPTGPKERSAEELENTRGFRSYGYGAGSGGGGGSGPAAGRRPYGGGFDDDDRRGAPPSRVSDLDLPSRADEADNWATGKRAPMESNLGRQDRYGSLGSGGSSKADEADSWFSNKKPQAVAPAPLRYSGFGSGFRDSAGSSDSDRWTRGGGRMMSTNGDRDVQGRPKLVLDKPKGDVGGAPAEAGKTRPSPFGAARPREEVLAEKGLDWRKMETDIEVKKTSRPTSSHSSRPTSSHSSRPGSPMSQVGPGGEGSTKARPKVNPFGDARPREVLLEEKGRDWRKIDLELEQRRIDRPESEEEKLLKEEINNLKKALAEQHEGIKNEDSESTSTEQVSLHEQVSRKEKDLEKLMREFNDKARFGQKSTGPGASRSAVSTDSPRSQSGIYDEPRGADYMDRPRSRGGSGDSYGRPMDDRRGFRGREAGFLGGRSMDRSSRGGW